jgi:hypothetical protein
LLLDDPERIPSQAVTQPIDPAIVTTTETPPAAARATSLVRMPLLHRDETNEQQNRRLSIHSEEVFPNANCTMCEIPKRGFTIRIQIRRYELDEKLPSD